jgi:hypothetical protein
VGCGKTGRVCDRTGAVIGNVHVALLFSHR